MCSAPVSVGCNAFCIFVMTMMLNPKSLSIATKQSVFFLAQRSISNLLHQMFFQMVYMYNFLTKWNTCVWINASLKDDDAIQRQVKSLYCAVNKLRGTFVQCSPAVKTLYFMPIACQCAVCLPIVEQIHTGLYEVLMCCVSQCLTNDALHTQKFRCLPTRG